MSQSKLIGQLACISVCTSIHIACEADRASIVQYERPPLEQIYRNDTAQQHGFIPNPAFVPRPASPGSSDVGTRSFALRQEGEVIVIEGDDRTVSSNGAAFGITSDNTAAIIHDVLAMYPDEFDTIQIYLSFLDEAHVGSAYYEGIANAVGGIGVDIYDRRSDYGLELGGRLSGFSNMNDMMMWGSFDDLAEPLGSYYAVIAQELSHRWLMNLIFLDTAGQPSQAFLGRQQAHWSALVHAYGSCQDGVFWIDNGDGTFTHDGESDRGWSPIEQYAMGIRAKEDVEPWFYLVEASLNGQMLGKESHRDIPRRSKVTARRLNVDVDDVIGALGPRNPPAGTETPYYRVALVLVTAPGQEEAAWRPYLEKLQEVGETFPDTWKTWTNGKGALCTKVSERCPEPIIGLHSYDIDDGDDGFVAPDEAFQLEVAIRNDGLGVSRDVVVSLVPIGTGVTVESGPITVPSIAENETVTLPSKFSLRIGADVACGDIVSLRAVFETKEGPTFSETFELAVGKYTLAYDALNEGPDWSVNPDGDDDAENGPWALATPEFISALGVVTQPNADHSPGDSKLAFVTGPRKGDFFSDNDVDGKTTLDSPVFALGRSRDPTLVFYAWHVALDFTVTPEPAPVEGADLVVLGSSDGGSTWVEMTRFSEQTDEWTRVEVRIKDTIPRLTNRMRFRFQVLDESRSGVVEAGIDDLEVIDYLGECELPMETPDAGPHMPSMPREESSCGCAVTAASSARSGGGLGLLTLFGALLFVRPRDRRRARRV